MMSRYVCIAITLLVTISLYIENSHGLPADATDTIGEWIGKVKPESQNPSDATDKIGEWIGKVKPESQNPSDATDKIGEWIGKVKPESQNPPDGLGPIASNILKPFTPEKPADSISKDKAFKGGLAKNDKMIKIDV